MRMPVGGLRDEGLFEITPLEDALDETHPVFAGGGGKGFARGRLLIGHRLPLKSDASAGSFLPGFGAIGYRPHAHPDAEKRR